MPLNEINELKDSFVKQLSPKRIYLFGSYAKGTNNEDSDFDFYIVVSDSEKDMIGLAAKAYKSIRHKQSRSVDIIVGTESRFEERKNAPTLENEVMTTGVLIYG